MYGEQIGFKYNFDKDTFFKAAATMYTYSGTDGSTSVTNVASFIHCVAKIDAQPSYEKSCAPKNQTSRMTV